MHPIVEELSKRPDLMGRVVVQFLIDASGRVRAAVVRSSDTESDRLDGCVVDKVRELQFPSPKGGGSVVVSYPFVFRRAP